MISIFSPCFRFSPLIRLFLFFFYYLLDGFTMMPLFITLDAAAYAMMIFDYPT